MLLELPETLLAQHARSKEVIRKIHRLKLKSHLTEKDLQNIAELKVELGTLSPLERGQQGVGQPVADILDELVKIERQNNPRIVTKASKEKKIT